MAKQLMIDTWSLAPYRILSESESASYRNESSFQSLYTNIQHSGMSSKVLCIVEGRFGKNKAVSVNGRYYGENFWDKQLAKEQTKFLLRKGLMWQMFGHVDRGIEDKDAEKGLVAGIVTHLEVIKAPREINGVYYNEGDLFGRAIIIDMCAGQNTYTLLSVGSEISISSRGLGEYVIGETHRCEDGSEIPIMNADTYEIETFDYTRLPGISDAEVHSVRNVADEIESIEDDRHNQKLNLLKDIAGEDSYDFDNESFEIKDSLLQSINESTENVIFNIQLKENNMKINGAKVTQVLEEANAKIASLTAKLEDAEEAVKKAEEERDAAVEECNALKSKTETEEAGTQPEPPVESPEQVKEKEVPTVPANTPEVDTTNLADFTAGQKPIEELEKFKNIADTPEELNDVLVEANEMLLKFKKENDGLKADVKEKEKDLKDAEVALESYTKLGSIAELKAIVESNLKLKKEARAQKIKQFAEHYSNKKGITQESVRRIIESSNSIKAAKLALESLPNKDLNKGLYKGESANVFSSVKRAKENMKSFAESYINKEEARRSKKSYTV